MLYKANIDPTIIHVFGKSPYVTQIVRMSWAIHQQFFSCPIREPKRSDKMTVWRQLAPLGNCNFTSGGPGLQLMFKGHPKNLLSS